jgi:type III restriction enzyme
VLDFLPGHFRWDDTASVGELELVKSKGETVRGTLILMSEWRTKLPDFLQAGPL